MKLKQKMVVGSIALAIIPMAIASFAISLIAQNTAGEEISKQARDKLVAVREIKKVQIEDYFGTIRKQLLTLSNDRMVIDAMREFKPAFRQFRQEAMAGGTISADTINRYRSQLRTYYAKDFGGEYSKRNLGESPDVGAMLDGLDADSIAMQYQYIKANSNPLGDKHKLDHPGDKSSYSRLHNKYHPHIRDFLDKFGYYDIFLVDSDSGDIVYSVFKELGAGLHHLTENRTLCQFRYWPCLPAGQSCRADGCCRIDRLCSLPTFVSGPGLIYCLTYI